VLLRDDVNDSDEHVAQTRRKSGETAKVRRIAVLALFFQFFFSFFFFCLFLVLLGSQTYWTVHHQEGRRGLRAGV
jgi:hypothetical protein